MRTGCAILMLLPALLCGEALAGCSAWNLDGFEIGMSEEEAGKFGRIGLPPGAPQISGSSSGGSIYRSVSVRAFDKSFKGRVKFRHGELTSCKLTYPGVKRDAMLDELSLRLGQPSAFGEADEFRSRDCNVRIRVTQKKKGVSLEMTAVRPPARSKTKTEGQGPPRIPLLDP